MAGMKIELNRAGVGKILKSDDMQKGLKKLAEGYAGSWKTDSKIMGTRGIASIYTAESSDVREELESHGLIRRLS